MNAMAPARRCGRKRKARITLPGYEAPTPQAIAHAVAMGLEIVVETYHTAAGEKTQLRRQRIVSPLEQLWKAGVLSAEQYGAARRYQHTADMAAVIGPGACVHYEPRMIEGGSPRFLLPMEAAADHLAGLAAAQSACGAELIPILEWISVEPRGWREQACIWWPAASERGRRAEFQRRLRVACDRLEWHYRRRRQYGHRGRQLSDECV